MQMLAEGDKPPPYCAKIVRNGQLAIPNITNVLHAIEWFNGGFETHPYGWHTNRREWTLAIPHNVNESIVIEEFKVGFGTHMYGWSSCPAAELADVNVSGGR